MVAKSTKGVDSRGRQDVIRDICSREVETTTKVCAPRPPMPYLIYRVQSAHPLGMDNWSGLLCDLQAHNESHRFVEGQGNTHPSLDGFS